jgi:hypothetical protein
MSIELDLNVSASFNHNFMKIFKSWTTIDVYGKMYSSTVSNNKAGKPY